MIFYYKINFDINKCKQSSHLLLFLAKKIMIVYIILIIILILILIYFLFRKTKQSKFQGGSFNKLEFKLILNEIGETNPRLLYENTITNTLLYTADNYKPIDEIYPENPEICLDVSGYTGEKLNTDDFINFIDELVYILNVSELKEIEVETEFENEQHERTKEKHIFNPYPMFKLEEEHPINFIGSYALLLNLMLIEKKITITQCKLKNEKEIDNINSNDYVIYSDGMNLNKLYLKRRTKNEDDSSESMEIIDDEDPDGSMEVIENHEFDEITEIVYMNITDSFYNNSYDYSIDYELTYNIYVFKYLLYLCVFETFFRSKYNIFTYSTKDIPYLYIRDNHISIYGKIKPLELIKRIIVLFEFFISMNNKKFEIEDNLELFYIDKYNEQKVIDFINSVCHKVVGDMTMNSMINYYNYIIYRILIQLYTESKIKPYKNLLIFQEIAYFRRSESNFTKFNNDRFNFISFGTINNISIKSSETIKTYYKFIDNRFNIRFFKKLILCSNLNNCDYLALLEYFKTHTVPIVKNKALMESLTEVSKLNGSDNVCTKIIKTYLEFIIMFYRFEDISNYNKYESNIDFIDGIFESIIKKDKKYLSKIVIDSLKNKDILKLKRLDKIRIILNLCYASLGLILEYTKFENSFPTYGSELKESIYKIITSHYDDKYLLVNGYFDDMVNIYIDHMYSKINEKFIDENIKENSENLPYISYLWKTSMEIFKNENEFKTLKILSASSYSLIIKMTAYVMDSNFMYKYSQIPKEIDKNFTPFTIFIGGSFHGKAYDEFISNIYITNYGDMFEDD